MNRYAHAFFCDDVRNEIGGKTSFIGVYSDKMLASSLPGTVPKLCVVISLHTAIDQRFESISIRGEFRGQDVFKMDLEKDQLQAMAAHVPEPSPDTKAFFIQLMAILSPLQIEGPGKIRLHVVADGEELHCGGLVIDVAPPGAVPEQLIF